MKNIRNNRRAFIIGAIIFALIVAGIVLTVSQSHVKLIYVLPNGVEFHPENAKNGTKYKVPDNPQMPEKWIFTGWRFSDSKALEETSEDTFSSNNEKTNSTVYAHAEGKQVPVFDTTLALAGGYGTNKDRVTLPLKLCGEVNVCAFELEIKYDPEQLKLEGFENEDPGVVVNAIEEEGVILLNYLDNRNTVGDVDLVDLVFKVVGEAGKTDVSMTVENGTRYGEDNKFEDVEMVVISSTVTIV